MSGDTMRSKDEGCSIIGVFQLFKDKTKIVLRADSLMAYHLHATFVNSID